MKMYGRPVEIQGRPPGGKGTGKGKLMKTPEECLKTVCAAAALAVTRKGAVPSIPKQAEVLAFLKTRKDES